MQSVLYDPRSGMTKTQLAGAEALNAARARMAEAAARAIGASSAPVASLCMADDVDSPAPEVRARARRFAGLPLNPAMVFSTFLVGASNRMAHAASLSAADRGFNYAPVFLHGRSGYGKTHLIQAAAAASSGCGVYLSSRMLAASVAALREYIARTPDCRVVAIDDVQCLVKQSEQRSLLSLSSMIEDYGRRLVIAADRPPADLGWFDEGLRSRLSSGLVIEIDPHDLQLRRDIAERLWLDLQRINPRFSLPAGALDLIADRVVAGGRDLHGVINSLMAKAAIDDCNISIADVETIVAQLSGPIEPKRIKIEDVQRLVARRYNVTRADLLSSRRTADIVRPRQVAMYLAKTMTHRSLPEIGRRFGGRDHTTVLHAVRKIDALAGLEPKLHEEIDALKAQLQEARV